MENGINFDIGIVNYHFRTQSKEEVEYAKILAEKYEKALYIADVKMDKFSENEARDLRYQFLENIVADNYYNNLITAHQLNDKLEWFFMQFAKGAGVLELIGMNEFELREKYRLLRPLIDISKEELLNYLTKNNIKYFIDASNFDEKYRRNYFRHNFSNRFLDEFKNGVKNSFQYLEEDKALLLRGTVNIEKEKQLYFFDTLNNDRVNIFYIDKILKRLGYILSSKQREAILKDREVVVGGDWVVAMTKNRIFISPYRYLTMPKIFKEKCRIKRVPKLIRPYLFEIRSEVCF